MLTPQEIAARKFDKVMVWGYDMNGVDHFLSSVEADYTQLYKENITLKSKMKVLVAKIEEYRAVDESMRRALLHAQTMANQIVEQAKAESANQEQIIQAEINKRMGELKERIAAEEMRLEEAKTTAQAFIDRTLGMYEKELGQLRSLREREFGAQAEAAAAPAGSSGSTIAGNSAAYAASAYTPADTLPDTVPLPVPPPPAAHPAQAQPPQAQPPRGQTPQRPGARRDTETQVYEVEPETPPYAPPYREGQRERRGERVEQPRRGRAQPEEDAEETIVLTPKPRFEFSNLQFGNQYQPDGKKGK